MHRCFVTLHKARHLGEVAPAHLGQELETERDRGLLDHRARGFVVPDDWRHYRLSNGRLVRRGRENFQLADIGCIRLLFALGANAANAAAVLLARTPSGAVSKAASAGAVSDHRNLLWSRTSA